MNSDPVYLPKIRIRSADGGQYSRRLTGKTLSLFLLLLVLGSLIGSFHLNQASHVATAGMQIVDLAKQRERLRQDNAELRRRIAEMESLPAVKTRAEELGLRDSDNVEYLGVANLPLGTSDQETAASVAMRGSHPGERHAASSALARLWEELTIRFQSWMNTGP